MIFVYKKAIQPNKKQKDFALKVAKDVLSRIMKKKGVDVEGGAYCIMDFRQLDDFHPNAFDDSLQKFVNTSEKIPCRVCALGAMFLSRVSLKNEVTISSGLYNSSGIGIADFSIRHIIDEIGPLNAQLIECAFEQAEMADRVWGDPKFSKYYEDDVYTLTRLAVKSLSSDDGRRRLRSICENIVRNGGVFVPKGAVL